MEMEETLKILNSSLSTIKWRLKSAAKLRLEIDILALCSGMRPVIMVDYGGKMPELQEYLCALLKLCQKESPVFQDLRVMIIEDMIYLIHVKELAEHVSSSLISEAELQFVDLEQDPPKMITTENSSVGMQLISVQKLFLSFFPLNRTNNDVASCNRADDMAKSQSSDEPVASQSSEVIDLSSCLHDTQVTVPTLNGVRCLRCLVKSALEFSAINPTIKSALELSVINPTINQSRWLLGYPVVYLFGIDHIADAIYNLSTKSLRIFRIVVSRNGPPNKGSLPEELMSFSVPYDLSMGGSKEPWAETFLAKMQSKWGKCKQTWRTLKMEVSECFPQAIAL